MNNDSDYAREILSALHHGDLHEKYLEFEENPDLHKFHPVLMYLLLHPKTRRYKGTLAWALTQADPRQYYPVFIHSMRTLPYEPTLWFYNYLIESIPSWKPEEKNMVRAMAVDASESCRKGYKSKMFAEIVKVVDESIQEV